ncbi:MAG: NADH-quinone oxidoreductase subunit NuoH [Opitutaceae bacterium]|jgi:NADH-quinone oxidoreductase subunit H|nr:NADH-quinone oxidoreductase subunit NuoH [Opitutaceae bacterium]
MPVTLETFPLALRDWLCAFLPQEFHWLLSGLLVIIAILTVFGLGFAFITVAERKFLGRFQNRIGPNRVGPFGLLQPFADAVKALTKEDIVPATADKLPHFLAPCVIVSGALLCFAVLPYGRHLVPADLDAGLLYFFAAGAFTELAVFMAGWSSHNKFSLLAGIRALAQLVSYELPLLLATLPAVMAARSLNLQTIVGSQSPAAGLKAGFLPNWHLFSPWGAAGFLIFLIAAIAESNRSPFDLPEGESEIIAGHLTEYSGFKYALFFMGEYFGLIALSGFCATLFLGGWQAPYAALEVIPSWVWFGLKVAALIFTFIWIRATFLRLRMDQLMRFSWKFLLPLALINLGTAAFWLLTAHWQGAWWIALRWFAAAALVIAPYSILGRRLFRGLGARTYEYAPNN